MKDFDLFLAETLEERKVQSIRSDKKIKKIKDELVEKYGETKSFDIKLQATIELCLRSAKEQQRAELRVYHEWLMKNINQKKNSQQ